MDIVQLTLAMSLLFGAPVIAQFMWTVKKYSTNRYVNKLRLLRWRLFGVKGRMDAEQEKEFWSLVADNILDKVDEWYLSDKISAAQRYNFLKKLQRMSGLAPEFKARNYQEVLKEEIIKRRGTDSKTMQQVQALPFPDRKKSKLNLSIRSK